METLSPKDKANELYSKFYQNIPGEEEFKHDYTINLAVLSVNDLITEAELAYLWSERSFRWKQRYEYWYEVKQELEKLRLGWRRII